MATPTRGPRGLCTILVVHDLVAREIVQI